MDPKLLFLRRVDQLARLEQSKDVIDLADMASILRQLLFDKHTLVDAVNPGLKLEFRIGVLREGKGPVTEEDWDRCIWWSLHDGIDPDVLGRQGTILSGSQLGQHIISYSRRDPITIKELVKYIANKKGAVHWDPKPSPDIDKMRRLDRFYIGEHKTPVLIRELRAISRVVLRGLDPLVRVLNSNHA